MTRKTIRIHELTRSSDPLLCYWLNMLQRQFPLDEQVLAGSILRMVQEREQGKVSKSQLWVALSEENEPVGMTWFDADENKASLWYIAVNPGLEGRGYGSALLESITDKVFGEIGSNFMVMEVENPTSHDAHASPEMDAQYREQVRKRNRFYIQKHGAWHLTGIQYFQQAGVSEAIPMDLLIIFHPERPIPTAEKAFESCKYVFGESLTQIDKVNLSREVL